MITLGSRLRVGALPFSFLGSTRTPAADRALRWSATVPNAARLPPSEEEG